MFDYVKANPLLFAVIALAVVSGTIVISSMIDAALDLYIGRGAFDEEIDEQEFEDDKEEA